MSMGQSQESTNIDETKETIKREVLDFIAQYGCGKAPDELLSHASLLSLRGG